MTQDELNFYCKRKCGDPDFSIDEWNDKFEECIKMGLSSEEMDKILFPEEYNPCEKQCEDCINIVLDTRSKNKKSHEKRKNGSRMILTEPISALNNLMWCVYDGDKITEESVKKWLNIAFIEGQLNPQIKKLEWEKYRDVRSKGRIWITVDGETAKTNIGSYELFEQDDKFLLYTIVGCLFEFKTEEEAKDFAQKDFEQMVVGCIETE